MENTQPKNNYQPNIITAKAINELASGESEVFYADTFEDFLKKGYEEMANDVEREKEAQEWIDLLSPN